MLEHVDAVVGAVGQTDRCRPGPSEPGAAGVTLASAARSAGIVLLRDNLGDLVEAGGKRQAERQEVTGDEAHRTVVPDIKRLPTPQAAERAVVIQAVTRIAGDRLLLRGGRPGVVQAEVAAHRIAAHGPAEEQVELGQGNGCCQDEDLTG